MSSRVTTSYWLWKARNKDPQAFAKIYDIYVDKIYRFVYFKVSDKEVAQDLCSECFLKCWEYLTVKEKEVKNLNALIYGIARNLVIDHYRKKANQTVSLPEEISESFELAHLRERSGVAREKIEAKIDVDFLQEVLHKLKDEYREVLLLKYIEEYSIGEMAQIMEKKNGAVRISLHRALKALRRLTTGQEKS